jgi:repressor LexA
MTPQQQRLLAFVERYQRVHRGVSPSFDEMAGALGLKSKSGVHRLIAGLSSEGRLRQNGVRSIEIIPTAADLSRISDTDLLTEMTRRGLLRMAA